MYVEASALIRQDRFVTHRIHVNPEKSYVGTNGEPPGEKKPTLQMVQSTLFLSYICEYY